MARIGLRVRCAASEARTGASPKGEGAAAAAGGGGAPPAPPSIKAGGWIT
jgi:hypothetical protein